MLKNYIGLSIVFVLLFSTTNAQAWIVKDSILKFPNGFSTWLKRNNGGIDSASPGIGNSMGQNGTIGTNQGVCVYDFNKDGKMDLIFQLFPSNNATREYLRGIFIQQVDGNYLLDTNYVIKGKGDMWYGGFGDFNGDGLVDYHYLTENYHGADSNRIYNTEMIGDNWPDRVFINNGKSFDTLSLDVENLQILSTYVIDIDGDGADEIIAGGREGQNQIVVYKYNKSTKNFYKIRQDITNAWKNNFNQSISDNPFFIIPNENNNNKIAVVTSDSATNGQSRPFGYKKISHSILDLKTASLNTNYWNRVEWKIPSSRFNEDSTDSYKWNAHQVPSIFKIDIDDDGNEEYVAGGFYMNDYSIKKHRFGYGWKVFDINGADVTTKLFIDSGYDRNVDLIAHGIDIDNSISGIELLPGTWGADGTFANPLGTIGYYYIKNNKKLERKFIPKLKRFDGETLPMSYLATRQIVQYPFYNKNQNAILTYDFQNIKRAAIIYQYDCSNAVKPTFEKSTYLICGNDSVNVKIINTNVGDTLKWFINNASSQLTGNANFIKTPDTISIQKIDSNGCKTTSNTIIIYKSITPSAPVLSRDTANYLVSTTYNTIWFKDGTLLSDTAQKIKPIVAGSYTAKTTQNGCISTASSAYYYIVTDVINLVNGEFIKLAPNPFQGNLNFDFKINGYQNLNIEVFELATGIKVGQRNNVYPGTCIPFDNLQAGTYIIRVISNENKVNFQFKMVKL